MKKMKRIFAIIAAVLLFGMYASTLIFALIGSPFAINLLKAAIASTFFVPVMIYACMLVYKNLKDHDS